MGPIVRLVSLVLILGTWWVMSGDTSAPANAPQVVASALSSIQ